MTGLERVTDPLLDVLAVLLKAFADDVELHGWAIMKTTRRTGPTVYGVLDRLEKAEWITGRWEEQSSDVNKPRRRLYRLTPTGAASGGELLAERRARAHGRQKRGRSIPRLANASKWLARHVGVAR